MVEDGEDDEDVSNHSDHDHQAQSQDGDESLPDIRKYILYCLRFCGTFGEAKDAMCVMCLFDDS